MEYTDNKIFFTLVKLLFILTTIVLLSVFNKILLCKYTKKNIETKYKLSTILQQFCKVEGLGSPLIVPSRLFWYRPISNTIGVSNLNSNNLVDVLAFSHELYHYKDRNRVVRIQGIVSIYTYLLSPILKFVSLYSIWFNKVYLFLRPLLMIDVGFLFVCLVLSILIEFYATRNAVLFLEAIQCIKRDKVVKRITSYSLLTYFFQFAIYIVLSYIVYYLLPMS